MTDFFRFPKTPHLIWLGNERPRQDKVLSVNEANALLAHPVTIEEKVDGANLGISFLGEELRVQNRGAYLSPDAFHAQFKPLKHWLHVHHLRLKHALGTDLILFGEWCFATHSIYYSRLPDWFLAFDVYDVKAKRFWSVKRRDILVREADLNSVPLISQGLTNVEDAKKLLGPSRLTDGPAEGVYLRWDNEGFLEQRAKVVRPEFHQAIGPHWTQKSLRTNSLIMRQPNALVDTAPETS